MFILFRGPVPDGLVLTHTCPNRRTCVNPAHLDAVTPEEHARRWNPTVTACPKGHPFTADNSIFRSDGRRRCRTCEQARDRARIRSDR